MWSVAYDGSRWVHPDTVITTLPDSSPLYVRTTLQTSKGDIPFTLSPSGNGSGCLVGVYYGWFSPCVIQMQSTTPDGMRSTYRKYFRIRRFSYERYQSCFHPNAVGVRQLVSCQFIKGLFSNPRE